MPVDASRVEHRPGYGLDAKSVLSATVVQYSDAPDRCTVSPPDATGDRRLTEWISVDADVVVSLANTR